MANEFLTNLEVVEASSQSTLKKMEAIIRLHIRMMLDQHDFMYIADHEWRHLPEPYLSNFLNTSGVTTASGWVISSRKGSAAAK